MVWACYEGRRVGRTVMEMNIEGRPKKKWANNNRRRYEGCWCVCVEDVGDRGKWRLRAKVADPK